MILSPNKLWQNIFSSIVRGIVIKDINHKLL